MKIYTRKGDDGTTGLLFGGRVRKDDPAPEAYGAVDEAQAALGVARAETGEGSELDRLLVRPERRALVAAAASSHVVPYLNRLSDLLWTMARWQEGQFMPARER